jgi:hypothetical protein
MRKHHSIIKPNSVEWPWPNFPPSEIASNGDGTVILTPESRDAMDKLQSLRDKLGHPLMVISGHRDADYNRQIGGAKFSKHVLGIAFDIRCGNVDPAVLISAARKVGFTSFGTYPKQGFVHIDTRPDPAEWGDPFPARTTRFAPEAKRPSAVSDLVETVPTPVAVGGAVEAALQQVAPHLAVDWQGYALMAAAAIGLGLALYRILKRRSYPDGA